MDANKLPSASSQAATIDTAAGMDTPRYEKQELDTGSIKSGSPSADPAEFDNINRTSSSVGAFFNMVGMFWMFVCTFVMWIPYIILKQMAETAIISMFGFLSSVVVVLIAVVISFSKPYLSHGPIPDDNPHAVLSGTEITHVFVHWAGIPTALATFSFAFAGNAIYPYIEGSMRSPRHWPYVSLCAMIVITAFYMLCGAAGYHAYGQHTVSPMLDNLPRGATSVAAQILIVIHVIIAVPVLMTSLAMEMEKSLKIMPQYMSRVKERVTRTILRTLLLAALMGVSMAIPYFSQVMTLVGALSTGCVFLIEPILFYWKLYGFRRIPWYEHIIGVVMLALGVLAMVLGTKDGAIALRDAIHKNN
ncbi:hypothetical protein GQ54DRAFT_299488 [Martensiomyces pterosporus]|nr:hypothetical protein GQ54DRAFT_299488 [Martensiomyces pterosporus]